MQPASISVVSVSANLESVFDVRDSKNLTGFVELIKNFRLSSSLVLTAKRLKLQPRIIRSTTQLVRELRTTRWREWPMGYDVPATPQIMGRIALDAGIEGIVYDSVLTRNTCIAIYPQNLQNSSSFVELDDPCPPGVVNKRIDAATFKEFL